MSTADIAAFSSSLDALRAQMLANMAALERQFDLERVTIVESDAPAPKAPTEPGTGQIVDKSA